MLLIFWSCDKGVCACVCVCKLVCDCMCVHACILTFVTCAGFPSNENTALIFLAYLQVNRTTRKSCDISTRCRSKRAIHSPI